MSEPINWREMSGKDKVSLILERVMGYYIVPDQYVEDGRHHLPLDVQERAGDRFAYWNDFGKCWLRSALHENDVADLCFDPLHDMNDVKLLRARMAELHPLLNLHLIVYTYNRCYAAFSLDRPVDDSEWSEGNGEYCMEEAICVAALRAIGCEGLV